MVEDAALKELEGFLQRKEKKLEKEAKIIYDRKQYTIRIPMKIARVLDINPDKDTFKFTLKIPKHPEEKLEFSCKLVRK